MTVSSLWSRTGRGETSTVVVGVLENLTTRYVCHSRSERVKGDGPVSQLFTDTPKTFWLPVGRLIMRVLPNPLWPEK